MIEQIVIWGIIVICALYVGKKIVTQLKRARDKDALMDCGNGCSCCSSESQCTTKDKQ